MKRTFRYNGTAVVEDPSTAPPPDLEYEAFRARCVAFEAELRKNDGPNCISGLMMATEITFGPGGREMFWP